MKKFLIIKVIIISILLLIFFGCRYFTMMDQKEWIENNKLTDNVDVHMCGTDSTNNIAIYWKNMNFIQILPNGLNANSIVVDGSDIYIGGQDKTNKACYWKNGVYFQLDSEGNTISYVMSLKESGGIIYATGFYGASYPCMWVGNKFYPTNSSGFTGFGNSIYADINTSSKIDLYIGGYFFNVSNYPVIWKNNGEDSNVLDLGGNTSGVINSITRYKGKIYSVGTVNGTMGAFWIDKNLINVYAANTFLTSIFITENEDIYYSGYTTGGTGFYYKNSVLQANLPGTSPHANTIYIFDEVLYFGGGTNNDTDACFWINSTLYPLQEISGASSSVKGIFVTYRQ